MAKEFAQTFIQQRAPDTQQLLQVAETGEEIENPFEAMTNALVNRCRWLVPGFNTLSDYPDEELKTMRIELIGGREIGLNEFMEEQLNGLVDSSVEKGKIADPGEPPANLWQTLEAVRERSLEDPRVADNIEPIATVVGEELDFMQLFVAPIARAYDPAKDNKDTLDRLIEESTERWYQLIRQPVFNPLSKPVLENLPQGQSIRDFILDVVRDKDAMSYEDADTVIAKIKWLPSYYSVQRLTVALLRNLRTTFTEAELRQTYAQVTKDLVGTKYYKHEYQVDIDLRGVFRKLLRQRMIQEIPQEPDSFRFAAVLELANYTLLENLNLPARVYNALKLSNIYHIEGLEHEIEVNPKLKGLRNFGNKAKVQIREALEKYHSPQ